MNAYTEFIDTLLQSNEDISNRLQVTMGNLMQIEDALSNKEDNIWQLNKTYPIECVALKQLQMAENLMFNTVKATEQVLEYTDTDSKCYPIIPIIYLEEDKFIRLDIKTSLPHRPKYTMREDLKELSIQSSLFKNVIKESFKRSFSVDNSPKLENVMIYFEIHATRPIADADNYDTKMLVDCVAKYFLNGGDNPDNTWVSHRVYTDSINYVSVYIVKDEDVSEFFLGLKNSKNRANEPLKNSTFNRLKNKK